MRHSVEQHHAQLASEGMTDKARDRAERSAPVNIKLSLIRPDPKKNPDRPQSLSSAGARPGMTIRHCLDRKDIMIVSHVDHCHIPRHNSPIPKIEIFAVPFCRESFAARPTSEEFSHHSYVRQQHFFNAFHKRISGPETASSSRAEGGTGSCCLGLVNRRCHQMVILLFRQRNCFRVSVSEKPAYRIASRPIGSLSPYLIDLIHSYLSSSPRLRPA